MLRNVGQLAQRMRGEAEICVMMEERLMLERQEHERCGGRDEGRTLGKRTCLVTTTVPKHDAQYSVSPRKFVNV